MMRYCLVVVIGATAAAVADGRGSAILKAGFPNAAEAAVIAFAYAVALAAGGAIIPAGGGVAIARPDQLTAGIKADATAKVKT